MGAAKFREETSKNSTAEAALHAYAGRACAPAQAFIVQCTMMHQAVLRTRHTRLPAASNGTLVAERSPQPSIRRPVGMFFRN